MATSFDMDSHSPTEILAADIIDAAGISSPGQFMLWEEDEGDPDKVCLVLEVGGEKIRASEDDWFGALQRIREQLAERKLRVRSVGACRDVYPSAMSRSMGGGLRAYRLALGRPARKEDLVSIFEPTLDEPATVAEQEAFYRSWLASIAAQ